MNRSLWIAATGMECQQLKADTVANNMANVNTDGYKRSTVHFQDMLYQQVGSPGATNANGNATAGQQIGSGARTVSVTKDFMQGSLHNSSSPLDFAVEGNGFFEVELTDGSSAYTRTGNFHLNSSGQVVTSDGYLVNNFPTLNPRASSIDVAPDGTVSQTVDGATTQVGTIQLARFANAEGLRCLGHSLYAETEASGAPTRGTPGTNSIGQVAQNFLESSNVEIVSEMIDMIAAQRAYELLSKSIKSASDMLRTANNVA